MATVLSPGDLAIPQYNSSSTTTDSFTFVFARDIEAGTVVNFTDNGWLAAGDFGRAKAQSPTQRPPRLLPVPSSR